jgi:hypothetical protein
MALFDKMRPINTLINLLEKEHDAIINGHFTKLAEVSASKESLMKSLMRIPPNEIELKALKRLCERNRKLLVASAQGLRSAHKRLKELQSPQPTFQTYGPTGSRAHMINKSLTIKKKI